MELHNRHSWMDMYLKWFEDGEELVGLEVQDTLRRNITRYKMIECKLYKRGFFNTMAEVCGRG